MRLFEQFGAPEFVLKVADVALSVADKEERSLVRINITPSRVQLKRTCKERWMFFVFMFTKPIIWSNIFKHHLELGHNDEAYAAITSNPDIER